MGKYVNNNIVSIPAEHKFGKVDDILRELGPLLLVGPRKNGKRYVADVCIAKTVNIHARFKPEDIDKRVNITDADRASNGYGLAIDFEAGLDNRGQLPIRFISKIWHVKPSGFKRIRDFDGYCHSTRSQLQLVSDVVVPSSVNNVVNIWTGPRPDGVPLDESIETMWKNADEYSSLKLEDLVEFGWIALTYSGFVRASGILASSFAELRTILQATGGAQAGYTPYYDFLLEPAGQEGKLIVYGSNRSKTEYRQLIAPTIIRNPGNIHPASINWTPQMTIGTTTTGFNITVKQWLTGDHSGQYIMFGTDDDLYFGFTITNNSLLKTIRGVDMKLSMTIGKTTYNTWFCDDSSSTWAGNFTVAPSSSYGPYQYSVGSVIYSRPRFFVQLASLLTVFPEFANQDRYDVTFGIWYAEQADGPLVTTPAPGFPTGNLVSRFTLPMQCTGSATVNPIDPPSDIKPTPPDWDIEIQD